MFFNKVKMKFKNLSKREEYVLNSSDSETACNFMGDVEMGIRNLSESVESREKTDIHLNSLYSRDYLMAPSTAKTTMDNKSLLKLNVHYFGISEEETDYIDGYSYDIENGHSIDSMVRIFLYKYKLEISQLDNLDMKSENYVLVKGNYKKEKIRTLITEETLKNTRMKTEPLELTLVPRRLVEGKKKTNYRKSLDKLSKTFANRKKLYNPFVEKKIVRSRSESSLENLREGFCSFRVFDFEEKCYEITVEENSTYYDVIELISVLNKEAPKMYLNCSLYKKNDLKLSNRIKEVDKVNSTYKAIYLLENDYKAYQVDISVEYEDKVKIQNFQSDVKIKKVLKSFCNQFQEDEEEPFFLKENPMFESKINSKFHSLQYKLEDNQKIKISIAKRIMDISFYKLKLVPKKFQDLAPSLGVDKPLILKTKSMSSVQKSLFVRKIVNGGQSSSPSYIEIVENNFGTKMIIEDVLVEGSERELIELKDILQIKKNLESGLVIYLDGRKIEFDCGTKEGVASLYSVLDASIHRKLSDERSLSRKD